MKPVGGELQFVTENQRFCRVALEGVLPWLPGFRTFFSSSKRPPATTLKEESPSPERVAGISLISASPGLRFAPYLRGILGGKRRRRAVGTKRACRWRITICGLKPAIRSGCSGGRAARRSQRDSRFAMHNFD